MRIIPAIDLLDGKCVRLTKGDYSTQKIYHEHPLEVARELEAHGIRYLHLVDLDGARSNRVVNHGVLSEIVRHTNLIVDFGGGLKTTKDLETVFEAGAAQVTIGSIAISHPELFLQWLQTFGPDRVILGADCRDRKISTQGWLEQSGTDILDFVIHYEKKGVQKVICTDIAKDGMLQGCAVELYAEILAATNMKLIASGGITTVHDLERLKKIGCEGAIIGKAIYEGRISLKELSKLC